MTQQQIVREFERFSKAEKSAVIRELLRIFENDLNEEKASGELDKKPFAVSPLRLSPREEFDFDNIGKLIEEIEGDSHK